MKKIIGKILVIILPIIAAFFLLYPTYRSGELEKLKMSAEQRADKAKTPADSLTIMENFDKQYGESLESAKAKRLKLGLDLRGGMYVTLEVDIIKLIKESAQRDAIDDTFEEVLNKTDKEAASTDQDVIDIFKRNFEQIAKPKKRYLSDYFDFGGNTDVAQSEDKIVETLKKNEGEAIDQAMQVIRQRIDKYGVSEPTIQKQGSRRIMLELPGVNNESEMRKLIQTTARLEFKLVKNDENLVTAFYKIDQLLSKQAKMKNSLNPVATDTAANEAKSDSANIAKSESDTTAGDSAAAAAKAKKDTADPYAGMSKDAATKKYLEDHPFTTLFRTFYIPSGKGQRSQEIDYRMASYPKGDYSFQIFDQQLSRFKEIINRKEVKALLPDDVQILLSAKPDLLKAQGSSKEIKAYQLYGLKKEPELTGEYITDAQATYDPNTNEPLVLMGMNSDGADKWARITGANIKKRIAIVLDEGVYSAPVVQNKIVGGSSQITGMSSPDEAKLLKIVLKAGALKAPVKIIEERVVGASLGDDSIKSGLTASFIAFMLVVLFMIIYYNKAGLVADLALLVNILLVMSVLAAFQGTLSLPGIAGIILTIGMAVDANILIFERIREELRKGRSLRSAVDEGFSKALRAILDTNTTSFITGLILYFVGTGPIKGFAMTLMIGILMTLFSQIVVARSMMEISLIRGASSYNLGQSKEITA